MKILEDILVLDLTQFWFGPFCTRMLADLGAEVIRIEPPWGSVDRLGDGGIVGGSSYTFHQLNLNKKGLTLNLKTEGGLKAFKELMPKADVVVQNFRPGTMERLGLGYDVLKELNPSIIYAALSGFGQTGPYRERPCFAPIAEAMSGHTRLTGDGIDPVGPPIEMAQSVGDLGPGLFAAMSVIAAIRHRDKTGVGQMIDVAQLDCMTSLNMAIPGYTMLGMLLHEIEEKYPIARGFGGLFQTKDGYIKLSSFSPRLIDDLRAYLGVEEVTEELINEKVRDMTREEAVEFLVAAKVPVAPIYQINDVVKDPHLIERDMFTTVNHTNAGPVKVVNFPVKFSQTPVKILHAAPVIGQHNREVLREILDFDDEQIETLKRVNAISR